MLRPQATILASALVLMLGTLHVQAAYGPPSRVQDNEVNRVLAPLAFVKFCMHQPRDCDYVGGSSRNATDMAELKSINGKVNAQIRPRRKVSPSGIATWAISPTSGDCNDYAVTKRHELLARGWASSDLLLSDVETAWGEPHLVLIVRTAVGNVVLDNLTSEIRAVALTGYRWVKQQSAEDPNIWIRASND